jgi:hypothetical protein
VRCPASHAKPTFSTECHQLLLVATWAYILTVALPLITAAKHLFDYFTCPAVLRVPAQKLVKVIAENLLEIIQIKPLSYDHAADSSTMSMPTGYSSITYKANSKGSRLLLIDAADFIKAYRSCVLNTYNLKPLISFLLLNNPRNQFANGTAQSLFSNLFSIEHKLIPS